MKTALVSITREPARDVHGMTHFFAEINRSFHRFRTDCKGHEADDEARRYFAAKWKEENSRSTLSPRCVVSR